MLNVTGGLEVLVIKQSEEESMKSLMKKTVLAFAFVWLLFTLAVYLSLAVLNIWYAVKTGRYYPFVIMPMIWLAVLGFLLLEDDKDFVLWFRFCWFLCALFICWHPSVSDGPFDLISIHLVSDNGGAYTNTDMRNLFLVFLLYISPLWYPSLRKIANFFQRERVVLGKLGS
jgi:hypothetical protein